VNHLGIDASEWQNRALPWAEWRQRHDLRWMYARVSVGTRRDALYPAHHEQARAAGVDWRGGYAAILAGDGAAQARVFVSLLEPGLIQFAVLDVEAFGVTEAMVRAFCDTFDAICGLRLYLYGNLALERILGRNNPRYDPYDLIAADYGPGTITSVPLTDGPRAPSIGGELVGWQYAGDGGRLEPYTGPIDLNLWYGELPTMTLKLGPHHMLGGGADTERWLALAPTVAKFVGDYGIAAAAATSTLTIGRVVDDGMLDNQGFDVNRIRHSHPVAQVAAAWYFDAVIRPKIATDPHIKAWSGPNEQKPLDAAAHLYYSEFCYWLAHYIRGAGRVPVVGDFAVGNPELADWQHYGLMAQGIRAYAGLLGLHEYGPLDGFNALRYRQVSRELARIGYSGIRMVITECGGDYAGGHTPFRGDYWGGDVGRYYREWCAPYAAEIARDDYLVGATLFTVGDGAGAWPLFDVNGSGLIDLISAGDTQPPPQTGDDELSAELRTQLTALAEQQKAAAEQMLALLAEPQGPPVLFQVQMTYPALNVRAGPGTTFADVGDVLAGQILDVYEVHSPSNWLRIHATEQRWISGSTTYHTRL
jgi:GH25 family lysozyme M1 (1,4-beta-N-acetylmuramidase)